MKRAICVPILGLMAIVPSTVSSDTVSIAGVTVYNGTRKGGISVSLAATEAGKPRDSDTSSTNGVFNLNLSGLQPDVTEMWVVHGDDEWSCRPLLVTLEPAKNGIRRKKVEDIPFTHLTQQAFRVDEAASVIAGLQETAAIEVRAGIRTEEEAKKKLADESAQILAKVPGLEPSSPEAKQVAQQSFSQINRRAAPKPYLDERGLVDLTNRPSFLERSHKNVSLQHPSEVPIEVLYDQFSRSLQQEAESKIGSGASIYKLYVQENNPTMRLDSRVPLIVRKGVQIPHDRFKQWLDINPDVQAYLAIKALKENSLPEDELEKKIKALRKNMILVVQPDGQAIQ